MYSSLDPVSRIAVTSHNTRNLTFETMFHQQFLPYIDIILPMKRRIEIYMPSSYLSFLNFLLIILTVIIFLVHLSAYALDKISQEESENNRLRLETMIPEPEEKRKWQCKWQLRISVLTLATAPRYSRQ